MTLEEAQKQFESLFVVVEDGPPTSMDKNGVPYTCIALGVKEECEPTPLMATGAESAIASWLDAAKAFAKDKPGRTLYWRTRPELHDSYFRECDEVGNTFPLPKDVRQACISHLWTVYSRLSIGP